MTALDILWSFWMFDLFVVSSCGGDVIGDACLTDYWFTITCNLNITEDTMGWKQTDYFLNFTSMDSMKFACPLVAMPKGYGCTVTAVTIDPHHLTTEDIFNITLCNKTDCLISTKLWEPQFHIQPKPPRDVEVQLTQDTFNVSWTTGYEHHDYLPLRYNLTLRTFPSHYIRVLPSDTSFSPISRSQLDLDSEYCVKVQSICRYNTYCIWSNWSPWACWKTKANIEQNNIVQILSKSLCPVFVAVAVLLFVFSPATRMKIKSLFHIPSPAPFFTPLYREHKGNLKEWMPLQGNIIITCNTQDLICENLTIVPKSIIKDMEQGGDLKDIPLLSTFDPCQMSYIGLPGMTKKASNENCQDGKLLSMHVVTKDLSDTIDGDSGWELEELSVSPDHSPPNSPICMCEDYCILNRTAEGIVPILISKGGNSPTVHQL